MTEAIENATMPAVLPPVLVDIAANDGTAICSSQMLTACSAALESRSCELAKKPEEAQATIRWRVDSNEAQVQVNTGNGAETRVLHFSARDDMCERWRSAGLVVASLFAPLTVSRGRAAETDVDETTNDQRPVHPPVVPFQQPEQQRQASAVKFPVAPTAPEVSPVWKFGIGALLGPGVGAGALRSGIDVEGLLLAPRQVLGATILASYARQPTTQDGIEFRWYSVDFGAVVNYAFTRGWLLEGSARGGCEWFFAHAAAVDDHAEETAHRVYPTLSARVEPVWRIAPPIEVFAGAELRWAPGPHVWVTQELRGTNPRWAAIGLFGLRVELSPMANHGY